MDRTFSYAVILDELKEVIYLGSLPECEDYINTQALKFPNTDFSMMPLSSSARKSIEDKFRIIGPRDPY